MRALAKMSIGGAFVTACSDDSAQLFNSWPSDLAGFRLDARRSGFCSVAFFQG
jgi:hypothetical protein